MVDQEICVGCGACINACPVAAISFDTNGKAKIDPEKCIKCHTCESICPVNAIEIR